MPRRLLSPFALASAFAATGVLAGLGPAPGFSVFVAAVYIAVTGIGVAFIRLGYFCDAVCLGPVGEKRVALTFDDGPDPLATPRILDTLRQHGVPAAFFAVGGRVADHPELARRVVQEGHLLENHTHRHAWWTNFLFGRALQRAVDDAQRAVLDATGRAPRYFRPPMGLTNPHIAGALRRRGLTLVGWDVRTHDRRSTPDKVARRLSRGLRDGSVVLLHDGGVDPERAVAILERVIREVRAHGFKIVRLDELIDVAAAREQAA